MNFRTAIKIMRLIEEPWLFGRVWPEYTRPQILKARRICRRKWMDRRVPYMPSDEELEERTEVTIGLLTDLMFGGPMFGEGILDGLMPDEKLQEARKQLGYDDKIHNRDADDPLAGCL